MDIKKIVLIVSMLILCTLPARSQVIVQSNSNADAVMEQHSQLNNKMKGKLVGFCVQICFESGANSREKAEKARMMFLSKYPNVNAYITFKEPNFRVRVGDFRTRAEARGFRKQILADFPQSFVIKDEIHYPEHNL